MSAVPVLARSLKYTVTISRGEGAGKTLSWDKPVLSIGRGPENDLVFANDPKMSRNHAEIRIQTGQLYIKNLTEKNFILVNGEKIDEKLIQGSVQIQIGETILTVKTEPAPLALVNPSPSMPATSKPAPAPKKNEAKVFQAPPRQQTPPPRAQQFQNRASSGEGFFTGRVRFYTILAAVGIAGYFFFNSGVVNKKQEVNLRTEGDVARAIEESANTVRELKKQEENTGKDSLQYKAAQENYIRGFRDYRQGQYARAMQSFQAALSFYPSHELARKYLVQSQRKFDEMVDMSMSQGRKYYQRQNYKMCESSFANVMIMVKDSGKPKYKEAKQFYDECSLLLEGRF